MAPIGQLCSCLSPVEGGACTAMGATSKTKPQDAEITNEAEKIHVPVAALSSVLSCIPLACRATRSLTMCLLRVLSFQPFTFA
jgi:hypothetical protein